MSEKCSLRNILANIFTENTLNIATYQEPINLPASTANHKHTLLDFIQVDRWCRTDLLILAYSYTATVLLFVKPFFKPPACMSVSNIVCTACYAQNRPLRYMLLQNYNKCINCFNYNEFYSKSYIVPCPNVTPLQIEEDNSQTEFGNLPLEGIVH